MDILEGKELVRADGATKSSADDALEGKKAVVLYFSAHWCPPCKRFTPILKEFYDKVSVEGVEVIFVSWDNDEASMLSYMRESHGDWWAVAHDSAEGKSLGERFEVDGIPTAVVLRTKDSSVVSADAVEDIEEKGADLAKAWVKE